MNSRNPSADWDDARLIEACLTGDERAWDAILQKYKRLIYSIILKYRFAEEDAGDIFQNVCLDLYQELGTLRQAEALRGWLARVTANKCFHWKRKQSQRPQEELDESYPEEGEAFTQLLEAAERGQLVRETVSQLSPRCREMLRMLFYEDPPRPYDQVASQLGLALGSIGFIRGRCLKKLADGLEAAGL